jgi:CheY-like chemotaxis protein
MIMSDLRILVVENDQNWQEQLADILRRLSGDRLDVAPSYSVAVEHLQRRAYDLVVVDLHLPRDPADTGGDTQWGWDLLHELCSSRNGDHTFALLVLTGYGTTAWAHKALRDYAVDDFMEKYEFDDRRLVQNARDAILKARLKQAATRYANCYRLNISFSESYLLQSELTGPDWHADYTVQHPRHFDVADLTRRADDLNWRILEGGPDLWRPEAYSIGKAVYEALARERRILENQSVARALTQQRFGNLWLQFSGPAMGLGVPFELLRDEGDYLVFKHVLTRRLLEVDTNKPQPFYKFIENLHKDQAKLRVLIVGTDTDKQIPAAESEATELAKAIEADLKCLSIVPHIELLLGNEATYTRVREELHNGDYHIFHYAGHGWYDETLPELSGPILPDGISLRTLTASDLNLLVRETKLRLVVLSCCLGARTALRAGRGDFYGMLEALAKADVPIVVGYRWTVADEPAKRLAIDFYRSLWRTFSPGEALLEARRKAALGTHGRDDETWAAPILLMQTA